MDAHTFIGSVGVTLLLLAYLLLQCQKLATKNRAYAVLNFVGAAMATYSSYLIDFVPFVVLEGTWALVSLKMIFKNKISNGHKN
jgi:hypothetical protein